MKYLPLSSFLATLLCLLLLAGCWNPWQPEPKPPDQLVYEPNTSAENVFANFIQSYNHKDYTRYQTLFRQDYRFQFWEESVSGNTYIPVEWGLSEELSSADGMFRDDNVTIDLSLPYQSNNISRWTDGAGQDTLIKIDITSTELTIDIRDKVTYTVNDPQEFYFKPDPDKPGMWLIFEWVDRGRP